MPIRIESELGGERAAAELGRIAARIREAGPIAITTHIHPDGDALGSEIALASGLRRLGKTVRVLNADPAPDKYAFLDPDRLLETAPAVGPPDLGAFDLGILLDAGEPSRTGSLEPAFFGSRFDRICLDHHPGPSSDLFALRWIAPASPATGDLVLRLLDELGVGIDRTAATALLVAVATDTGWFRFSNTTSLALRDAARLLEAGIEIEEIHRRIYEDMGLPRTVLLGRVLAGIRTDIGGRFAWALIDHETLEGSGVPMEDLDGFTEQLKGIGGVDLVAFLVEMAPRAFKVSLRSKGSADVRAIAAAFGGGGHVKAAGFRTKGDPEEVIRALVDRVREELARPGRP
jgi:phosphoesterase RecJ-like protein